MKSSEHFESSTRHGTGRDAHASQDGPNPLDVLSKFQADVFATGGRLLEIYRDRARLSTRRALVALIGGVGAAIFFAVVLASAAAALMRGLCAAFTELFGGRAWLGNLTGGLVVIAIFGLALYFVNRASDRKALKSLRAKYGDAPHENNHANGTETHEARREVR